jgi:hypothetical protein
MRFLVSKGLVFIVLAGLFACGGTEVKEFSQEEIQAAESKYLQRPIIIERKGIKIKEQFDFPKFNSAELSVNAEKLRFQPGMNTVEFAVSGMRLGEQTKGMGFLKDVNNSVLGQNIYIISKENESKQIEKSTVDLNLEEGKNKIVAFLNRSYNVALKSKESRVIFEVSIDDNGSSFVTIPTDTILHIISPTPSKYSPKSEVLFDVFINGIDLSEKGNYLGLYVDNLEFRIYKNAPFSIEGLKPGKHTLQAKLFNENGDPIQGVDYFTAAVSFEVQDSFEY